MIYHTLDSQPVPQLQPGLRQPLPHSVVNETPPQPPQPQLQSSVVNETPPQLPQPQLHTPLPHSVVNETPPQLPQPQLQSDLRQPLPHNVVNETPPQSPKPSTPITTDPNTTTYVVADETQPSTLKKPVGSNSIEVAKDFGLELNTNGSEKRTTEHSDQTKVIQQPVVNTTESEESEESEETTTTDYSNPTEIIKHFQKDENIIMSKLENVNEGEKVTNGNPSQDKEQVVIMAAVGGAVGLLGVVGVATYALTRKKQKKEYARYAGLDIHNLNSL
eukprot:Pgem_evm1s9347